MRKEKDGMKRRTEGEMERANTEREKEKIETHNAPHTKSYKHSLESSGEFLGHFLFPKKK